MNRRSRWLVGVVVSSAVLVFLCVGLLAASGGIRISDPLDEMEAFVGSYEPPAGAVLVRTVRSTPDRVCFLQCSEWFVEAEYRLGLDAVGPADCEDSRRTASDWLDEEFQSEPFEAGSRSGVACIYGASGTPADESWCATVLVLDSERPDHPGANLVVRVVDGC